MFQLVRRTAISMLAAVTWLGCSASPESTPDDEGVASDEDAVRGKGKGGGKACKHDVCETGANLNKRCDPCVATVCDVDGSCCREAWDDACVAQAESLCGVTCDAGSAGGSGAGGGAGSGGSGSAGGGSEPPSTCEGASDATTNLDADEQTFLALLNDYRADNGLGPVTPCTSLSRAAQGHSEDMRDQNYFSHTGLDGSSPWQRAAEACYESGAGGEIIAAGYQTPEAVFAGWQNSPGHNAIMLGASFGVVGIGRASGGGSYGIYWTGVFANSWEVSCE